jgi:hypothetical protein
MNIKKITKKIEKYANRYYSNGYDAGFADYRDNYALEAFNTGAEAERERIQTILDMHIQWALESGKGTDVIMLNKIKEIIVPIVISEDENTIF